MSDNDTTQHTTFTSIDYTPVYAGHWSLGGKNGMRICLAKRPNWFHQKMTYIFIGWKWTDTKENTEEFDTWCKESDDGNAADYIDCKTHPDAPHSFLRNSSHNAGRYVCQCEHWEGSE